MLRRVDAQGQVAVAITLRRTIADGPGAFNDDWLKEGGRVVMPQESGRHLEADECARLATVLSWAGVTALLAISNDPLVLDDMAYELASTADDLEAFSREFSGINAVVVPTFPSDIALLFSTDDFHLIAGPVWFITKYVGDPRVAKQEFLEFARGHFEVMRPTLEAAARYLSWVDSIP